MPGRRSSRSARSWGHRWLGLSSRARVPRGRRRCTTPGREVDSRLTLLRCIGDTDALGRASAGRAPVGHCRMSGARDRWYPRARAATRPDDERRAAARPARPLVHSRRHDEQRSPAPIAPGVHDRHPRRRPARADAGVRGAGHRATGSRPGPRPRLPGRRRRRPRRRRAATTPSMARIELRASCAVVTYELEHVDAALVDAVEAAGVPGSPGRPRPADDPGPAGRAPVRGRRSGSRPRPGARSPTRRASRARPRSSGRPLRLKAPIGGYDGRSQVRIATPRRDPRRAGAAGPARPARRLLVERELDFDAELSVITARALDGTLAAFPIARNRHDAGILVESVAPAPVRAAVAAGGPARSAPGSPRRSTPSASSPPSSSSCATARWPSTSWRRASTTRGHWTIEGARTSQFEQHVRAICGLPLGDPTAHGPTAMVNLLGHGRARGRPAWRAPRRRWPTRSSTSTCTTSGVSSSAGRWGT